MYYIFIMSIFLSFQLNTISASSTYYVLGYPYPHCGLFSSFRYVLSALYSYEENKSQVKGLEINFGKDGAYYDPLYGPNSWEYYCEPIRIGSPGNAKIGGWNDLPPFPSWFYESREMAHAIISKYIRVKPHILQKVDHITHCYFDTFIIGIHYRGTDKIQEANRLSYEDMVQAVYVLKANLKLKNFKIFVATDEYDFLEFMRNSFPGQIICYEESYRSTNGQPIHHDKSLDYSPYKKGEDAFIDCLLLSKCNYLIATCSHLSICSSYFNLSLPFVVLNRYR